MNVLETKLPGVVVIEPDVYQDERGAFMEAWNARCYRQHGLDVSFVQDNVSRSRRDVLRGLHFQNPYPQGKLVSVLEGQVYDVVVDIRVSSKTFGAWLGMTLSSENARQVYVPEGFAHGFLTTSEKALFQYKCTDFYHPEAEKSLRWNDPKLGIEWPVEEPVLSEKDAQAPLLENMARDHLQFRCAEMR
jgi:dTDP-4-dehydrorhamnose 3,5-epimerase